MKFVFRFKNKEIRINDIGSEFLVIITNFSTADIRECSFKDPAEALLVLTQFLEEL